MQNPAQFKIPSWFLNRQKDIVDGKNSQILSNAVDSKLRDDLERLKKIRAHRGLRHVWGIRVRGQHTKTTGTFEPFFRFIFSHVPSFVMALQLPTPNADVICFVLHLRLRLMCGRSSWQDCWCVEEAWINVSLQDGVIGRRIMYVPATIDHVSISSLPFALFAHVAHLLVTALQLPRFPRTRHFPYSLFLSSIDEVRSPCSKLCNACLCEESSLVRSLDGFILVLCCVTEGIYS